MSVQQKIVAALKPFGDPVQSGTYTPEDAAKEKYYTFNIGDIPTDHADDAPNHEINLVQVHFFCPKTFNSVSRAEATKQALFAAGFTWPSKTDATDEDGQHLVFECQDAQGVVLSGVSTG